MNHTIGQPLRIFPGPVRSLHVRGLPIREVADLFECCVHKFAWVQPHLDGWNVEVSYVRVGVVLGVLPDKAIIFQRTAETPPIIITPKQTLSQAYQLFRLEGGFADLTVDDWGLMQTMASETSLDDLLDARKVSVPDMWQEDIAIAEVWIAEPQCLRESHMQLEGPVGIERVLQDELQAFLQVNPEFAGVFHQEVVASPPAAVEVECD